MRRIGWAVMILGLSGMVASRAWADEEVHLRDGTKVKIAIKSESTKGITPGGKAKFIPAEEIVDVIYLDMKPVTVRAGSYRAGQLAEKDADDPGKDAKAKENLAKAIAEYQATLKEMVSDQASAQQHLEFKLALLQAHQARKGVGSVEDAIKGLNQFLGKNKNCWQFLAVLKELAELQISQRQYDDAEKTYKAIADADISDQSRQEAELAGAQIVVKAGKYKEAMKKLDVVIAKLPKNSPGAFRARIAQGECLVAAKAFPEARKKLKEILNETKDNSLKAAAYNTLGKCDFDDGAPKEALWAFLWVDVVYNQDRAEHAKALYYLMRIFDESGDSARAREFREALNDPQFQGLEYQRLAREKGEKEKK